MSQGEGIQALLLDSVNLVHVPANSYLTSSVSTAMLIRMCFQTNVPCDHLLLLLPNIIPPLTREARLRIFFEESFLFQLPVLILGGVDDPSFQSLSSRSQLISTSLLFTLVFDAGMVT